MSDDESFLTLQQIADHLGESYQMLRKYADHPFVIAFMGATPAPNGRGLRWPVDSLAKWAALNDMRRTHKITPRNVSEVLSDTTTQPAAAPSTEIAPVPPQALAPLLPDSGTVIRQIAAIWPPADCLLTPQEAAEILACHPDNVRKYVRPVRRGRWRRSDLYRYIQSLEPVGDRE